MASCCDDDGRTGAYSLALASSLGVSFDAGRLAKEQMAEKLRVLVAAVAVPPMARPSDVGTSHVGPRIRRAGEISAAVVSAASCRPMDVLGSVDVDDHSRTR
jgi:hypothetical protein